MVDPCPAMIHVMAIHTVLFFQMWYDVSSDSFG